MRRTVVWMRSSSHLIWAADDFAHFDPRPSMTPYPVRRRIRAETDVGEVSGFRENESQVKNWFSRRTEGPPVWLLSCDGQADRDPEGIVHFWSPPGLC